MKKYLKFILTISLLFCILLPYSYAANKDKVLFHKASVINNISQLKKNIKQKLNIISKNNREIKKLQNEIKSMKNNVMIKISNLKKNKQITKQDLISLKNKVKVLKNYNINLSSSNDTIHKAAKNIANAKTSKNFYGIISQYDLIIEEQNDKIISMKNIIKNINEIK